MQKHYLVGIDIGTSAAKAALFEKASGNRALCVTSVGYPVFYPQPSFVEQNPDDWWRAAAAAVRELIEKSGIDAREIAGVGIDGQSWAAVMVDAEGNVICPTPIWADTRSAAICERLNAAYGEERFLSLTKNPLQAGYTFPKILWYKERFPDIYRRTAAVLQSNGYIAYRLTGVLSHDRSQANSLAVFDMEKGVWDEDFCRELGVRPDMLPPLFDPDEIVGTVTAAGAAATGLAVGTPVVAGGLDTACDALGAGVVHPGETQEQGGQSGGMSICTDFPVRNDKLVSCRHVVKGRFLLQGGTVGGGALLRWFNGTFGALAEGDAAYAEDDRAAALVPPGADGLVLLPYFAGERSPVWDPMAKGVYYGVDYQKSRAHFVRANLEAAAYALRHNLEAAAESGVRVTVMRASGGAAKSPLWTQIKADVTGCPIEVPEAFSTAAFGAATLAGVATGVFADYEEAAKGIRVTRRHEPDADKKAVYDRTYTLYRALYRQLAPLMHGKD